MKGKIIKVGAILGGLLLLGGLLIGNFPGGNAPPEEGGGMLSLVRPAFAQAAEAGFLEDEAGIVAYANIGRGLNPAKAKGAFKAVETPPEKERDYIIGSVELPGYPDTENIHCYISSEGWIVAYYMKEEPLSKIIDWVGYSGGGMKTTKLEKGLSIVCNAAGVGLTGVKYYHFKCPEANKLVIIIGKNKFRLKIPGGLTVYERSWACMYEFPIRIDRNQVSDYRRGYGYYGILSPAQLEPDIFHTIEGNDYFALALAYRES